MRDDEVDVVGGEARSVERPADRIDHAPDSNLEDRLALEVEARVRWVASARELSSRAERRHHHRRAGDTIGS